MENIALDLIEIADFEKYENKELNVWFSPRAKLAATVRDLKTIKTASSLLRKSFSIILRTNQKKEYYQQAIYIIEHPDLGNISVFMTPVGFDDVGMQYEVIFS
jgi:hypothetical protein